LHNNIWTDTGFSAIARQSFNTTQEELECKLIVFGARLIVEKVNKPQNAEDFLSAFLSALCDSALNWENVFGKRICIRSVVIELT
jgi:hypothetical protein